MLTIIVSPAKRGNYVAHLKGRQLCNATRSPFLAAARQLLSEGADPATKIIMGHAQRHRLASSAQSAWRPN
jgi:hypothetical protein